MTENDRICRAVAINLAIQAVSVSKGSKNMFITKDLFDDFVQYSQKASSIAVDFMSFGIPISKIRVVPGTCGMFNNVKFHIIQGINEIYAGAEIPFDKILEDVKKVEGSKKWYR